MKFVPEETDPCHPNYHEYSPFALELAKDITLRYYAQGGIDYSTLQPWMLPKFKLLLKEMSGEFDATWKKAWETLGKIVPEDEG